MTTDTSGTPENSGASETSGPAATPPPSTPSPGTPPARPSARARFGATWFNSWRAAVRIARRDAWRSKGRSAMVLAMIALPIVGVSAADITFRSSQLTTEQKLTREMGAADARIFGGYYGKQPVLQTPVEGSLIPAREIPEGSDGETQESESEQPPVDPRVAMPAGARWIADVSVYAQIRSKSGLLFTQVRELAAADPIAAGITDLDRGRYPATRDEMIATTAFLKASGLHVGSRVRVRDFDRVYRIVGAYELPDVLKNEQLLALPGAFVAPYADALKAAGSDPPAWSERDTYLVSVPGDFTWDMVKQANTQGVVVVSRAVRLHPPADSDVPYYQRTGDGPGRGYVSSTDKAAAVAAPATIVALSILEICLLAGPAFAVGARRSRRQLGLVGANGGDRRHIRAVVLSGGLVIGAAAAVIGTLLGLGLTVALRGVLENNVGKRFGGISIHPLELLAIAGLAVLVGVLAAVVPAVTASRQSVLSSLTGRRGVRHANRVLPVVGLAAVCLGAGVAIFGATRTDSAVVVGLGSGIAELGIVALTPTLVGLFGRFGRWLPLAPRLALRDAVRNRGRTAPAVAAVLAAVAGTVAVATYAASEGRQERDEYTARVPKGVVTVSIGTHEGRELGAVRAAIEKRYPVSGRADVYRAVYGAKSCDLYTEQRGCGDFRLQIPQANRCPGDESTDGGEGVAMDTLSLDQRRARSTDWRCHAGYRGSALEGDGGVTVGGPAVLHALGIRDIAAEQALARGETVLFDRRYADHGTVTVRLIKDKFGYTGATEAERKAAGAVKSLPVQLGKETKAYGLTAVMPVSAAKAIGLRTVPFGSFYTTSTLPSGPQRQALAKDLAELGTDADLYLESGYHRENSLPLLALTLFAGLVTIGAAGIATGLSQADAEPDLKTLAAIGAAPGVRRRLSGFQCGVVATMGVVLGSLAGILPAIGLRRAERRSEWKMYHQAIDSGWGQMDGIPHVPVVLPWLTLAMLLVAVPVGATLLAALVTRSRAQLSRRAQV